MKQNWGQVMQKKWDPEDSLLHEYKKKKTGQNIVSVYEKRMTSGATY